MLTLMVSLVSTNKAKAALVISCRFLNANTKCCRENNRLVKAELSSKHQQTKHRNKYENDNLSYTFIKRLARKGKK